MKKIVLLGLFAIVVMHGYLAPVSGANYTHGPKLVLTFYWLPGDPFGKRVRLFLHELKKRHGGLIVVRDLDATTEANKSKQYGYGFSSHGLIVEDHDRKVVFKQADHGVRIPDINEFVDGYLKKH